MFVHNGMTRKDLVSACSASSWLGTPSHVSNRDPDPKPGHVTRHTCPVTVDPSPPYCSWWSSRITSRAFLSTALALLVMSATSVELETKVKRRFMKISHFKTVC